MGGRNPSMISIMYDGNGDVVAEETLLEA